MELADGDADEAEGREADGCGHFTHLAVAAFTQSEFDPTGGDVFPFANGRITRRDIGMDLFCFGGKGFASFDNHAGAQLLQRTFGHLPFQLRPVGAWVGVFRIKKFGVQSGFVGEKEQALAVTIETPEGVDVFRELEFGQRALSGMIRRELGEDSVGFV